MHSGDKSSFTIVGESDAQKVRQSDSTESSIVALICLQQYTALFALIFASDSESPHALEGR